MYVHDFYDGRFLNEKWIAILSLKLIENGHMWLAIYFKITKIKVVCIKIGILQYTEDCQAFIMRITKGSIHWGFELEFLNGS